MCHKQKSDISYWDGISVDKKQRKLRSPTRLASSNLFCIVRAIGPFFRLITGSYRICWSKWSQKLQKVFSAHWIQSRYMTRVFCVRENLKLIEKNSRAWYFGNIQDHHNTRTMIIPGSDTVENHVSIDFIPHTYIYLWFFSDLSVHSYLKIHTLNSNNIEN